MNLGNLENTSIRDVIQRVLTKILSVRRNVQECRKLAKVIINKEVSGISHFNSMVPANPYMSAKPYIFRSLIDLDNLITNF